MRWRRASAAVVGASMIVTAAGCEPVQRTGWDVDLVTANAAGTDGGNAATTAVVVSPDGALIAFGTVASNLGPTDTNRAYDVYLRDLRTGATTLVSTNPAGTDGANSSSSRPVFSPDGTKLAFVSWATDLGPADADRGAEVYVLDLATSSLTRVPNAPDDCPLADAGDAGEIVFSADGMRLAFGRTWWDAEEDPLGHDIFVHDLATGATAPATPHADGVSCGAGDSLPAGFSPDGTQLVFSSTASDLVPADDNGVSDIFVRDLGSGSTRLLSESTTRPGSANGASSGAAVSVDGRVAFRSDATDLGPNDVNSRPDVYARSLPTGATTLVSSVAGEPGGGGGSPMFSPDGTKVAFTRFIGMFDGRIDVEVYVADLATGASSLVSVNVAGAAAAASQGVAFAGNDRVVFFSMASDLGPPDSGFGIDLYLRDLAAGRTVMLTANASGTGGGNRDTRDAAVSSDGNTIAFVTQASNLGPPDANGLSDVYVTRYGGLADLGATLDVEPQATSGDELAYRLVASNVGPDAAEGAAAAVVLPEGTAFVAASTTHGACTAPPDDQPQVVTCELGTLDPGASVEVDVTARVTAAPGTPLGAVAAIDADTADPDESDNLRRATSTVVAGS